ncbi:MAG: hypothetical protein M3296_09525 [Actinomycetota bacterium]|nr:hypothetical protein [Actinomycetota bacterium]
MVDVRRLCIGEVNEIALTLDDLVREGARRMIAAAATSFRRRWRTAR